MRTHGLNLEQTKRANRLLVLRLLCTSAAMTRTEISRQTGLAKMTISNIVTQLLRAGIAQEVSNTDPGHAIGRPQTRLELAPCAPQVLGIWISRDRCVGIRAAMDLRIQTRAQVPLPPSASPEHLLDTVEQLARELLADCAVPVPGMGIVCPGPLDPQRGVILNPPDFYGVRHLPIAAALSERLGLPVFLHNDMNAAAMAEKLYGCGRDLHTFAYVGLTSGVGAGLIVGNSLLTGSHGFAGELGHVTVDPSGPLCACGNRGCLETYVSVPALLRQFSRQFHRSFADLADLCDFCETDAQAASAWETESARLALALTGLCNLFDPQAILLGHEGAALTDRQIALLSRQLAGTIFARDAVRIPVRRSSFGELAPVYGAAVTLLQRLFDGTLPYPPLWDALENSD